MLGFRKTIYQLYCILLVVIGAADTRHYCITSKYIIIDGVSPWPDHIPSKLGASGVERLGPSLEVPPEAGKIRVLASSLIFSQLNMIVTEARKRVVKKMLNMLTFISFSFGTRSVTVGNGLLGCGLLLSFNTNYAGSFIR